MKNSSSLLGYDIGSSSVKASLIDPETGNVLGSATSPGRELKIQSIKPGWAEQNPDVWWDHIVKATRQIFGQINIKSEQISVIGITYQMHGLVAVDQNGRPLRPSIIWCDSRAADIGNRAFNDLGQKSSLENYLNSPGNFTASKLKWVQENEPEIYKQIHKVMLPGDYIGMKLTGEICTTESGLSEGIFWNYKTKSVANELLDYYQISKDLLPEAKSCFEEHGKLTEQAAKTLGLKKGTKVTYRAGDQPNNAFSLNVLNPGEVAATAGTSGVVYGVADEPVYDAQSRVNTFIHVNHKQDQPRYGVLLYINGTGILNSWLRQNLAVDQSLSYEEMNSRAQEIPVGADGVSVLPFGNGAERILENADVGASIHGLNFNRHTSSHLLRAAQEGIVFSLNYGFQIMKEMGMRTDTVKAGHANMFLSPLFRDAFVQTTGAQLELYDTDGAAGAARGAGLGAGIYNSADEAFGGLTKIDVIEPDVKKQSAYSDAYGRWLEKLKSVI
jgi:xylulokinase